MVFGFGGLIVGNAVVVVVTWRKTLAQWYQGQRLGIPVFLTSLLLREGEDRACSHGPGVR